MTILRSIIVGSHFRPPAKQVLARLSAGLQLGLELEPENPYDSGAIRVMLERPEQAIQASQRAELENDLAGCGWSWEQFCQLASLQLGYCCASSNKKELTASPGTDGNLAVAEAIEQYGTARLSCKLGFHPNGKAQVELIFNSEDGI